MKETQGWIFEKKCNYLSQEHGIDVVFYQTIAKVTSKKKKKIRKKKEKKKNKEERQVVSPQRTLSFLLEFDAKVFL